MLSDVVTLIFFIVCLSSSGQQDSRSFDLRRARPGRLQRNKKHVRSFLGAFESTARDAPSSDKPLFRVRQTVRKYLDYKCAQA